MSGNTVGSLLGAGIGFLIGGPVGAKWGFFIGGQIGGYVDPQKIKGPRLSDASRQTSMEGIPIPWGYGTFPTAGNIIFAGPLVEHEHEEGGKGGPVTVTYTYTRSYAVGICEGPISGIQKIKRNGKLVYDISPDSEITGENAKFLEKCTIYLGDETQNVDPTIEAIVGVGETGPMRGLAYMVMEDDDLTETQGAIAQYEFVVQMCGTVTESDAEQFVLDSGPELYYPIQDDLTDHTGNNTSLAMFSDTIFNLPQYGGVGMQFEQYQRLQTTGSANFAAGITTQSAIVRACVTDTSVGGAGGLRNIAGCYNNSIFLDCWWALQLDGPNNLSPSVIWDNTAGGGQRITASFDVVEGQEFLIGFRRNGTLLELLYNGGVVGSTAVAGGGYGGGSSPIYINGMSSGAGWVNFGFIGSVGQLVGWNSAPTDTEIFDTSLALGQLPEGWFEAPDAPGVLIDEEGNIVTTATDSQSLSSCTAVLSDVVEDLCRRAGVDVATEVDTSELTDEVVGFKCATEAGADQFIESLTVSHFFDRAEWDKKLRFPKRGGPVQAALTMDDLVMQDGAPITQTRVQEPELLRKVNVLSIDAAADYNVTKQTWERRAGTIRAVGEASVEIPEVVETDTAAQIAEIRGKIAWAETDKFAFGLPVKWSKLTPTDRVTLADRAGLVHRMRLQDVEEELGRFSIREAIKDRASVYSSSARGVVNSNTPGTTSPGIKGPTLFAAMNLPQMRSQDGSGLYVGMAGLVAGWSGAQLFMSVDGGVSYSPVLTVTVPTKMGYLTADLDAVGSASEPLSVIVYGGQLSSATGAQVAQGVNYSAVETDHGTAGKIAEVLAYETATPTSSVEYNLTTLTRAIKGTERLDHFEGDVFMDLSTSYFLPIDTSYAGQTLLFKAVSFGVSIDAVTAAPVEYTPRERVHDGGGDPL